MEELMFGLIWLGFFATLFFGWYFYLQARNKERMALIERNADVTEIYKPRSSHFPWLKLGMLIAGLGLGFIVTMLLNLSSAFQYLHGDARDIGFVGSMLFFGGAGVVTAYFIERPNVK